MKSFYWPFGYARYANIRKTTHSGQSIPINHHLLVVIGNLLGIHINSPNLGAFVVVRGSLAWYIAIAKPVGAKGPCADHVTTYYLTPLQLVGRIPSSPPVHLFNLIA